MKNKGKSPIYQLRAVTKSDGPYWDEKELAFGRIQPGETRTANVPLGFCDLDGRKPGSTKPVPEDAKRVCKIPKDANTRQDIVRVQFSAEGAEPPRDAEFRPTITELPRPIFAYNYEVVDNRPGDGDGELELGEGVTIYLNVKNVGKGPSYETQANLRNVSGDGLLLHAGRFDISNMKPGEGRNVAFTFDVLESLAEPTANLEISVTDRDLRVGAAEKPKLPIAKTPLAIRPANGLMSVPAVAAVRGQPLASAPVVGQLAKGSLVERLGVYQDYTKVNLGDSRFGFVESRALKEGATGTAKPQFDPVFSHSPPLLEVAPASLSTRDHKVHVAGHATDSDRVKDVFVFVGPRKVFYQSNGKAPDPKRLDFAFDAELQPGVNVITVVARENEDTVERRTMIVRRDGPNGESLPTPKAETLGEDWDLGAGGD